jgi:hypothetical protein
MSGDRPDTDESPATDDSGSRAPAGERDETTGTAAEPFEQGGDLRPREVDRVFEVLDEAVSSEAFGGRQFDRLLGVLERTVARPAETDPDTIAELVEMFEEVIVEPDDLSEVDIDGVLSIIEEAIAGTTVADQNDVAAIFDVVETGLRDPTAVDPAEAEQFRSSIENVVLDVTDPAGDFGGLFALPMLAEDEAATDEPVDMLQVARIGAALTQRASGYSMEAGVRTGTRMTYAAVNSESPAELLDSVRAVALDELQRAGINLGDQQSEWLDSHEDEAVDPKPLTQDELRERGTRLISQSAEVGRDESVHPAFDSILTQLATDEGRILRLLATEGPQGALDIYDKTYVPFRTRLVAEDLTMLGSDAGCRNEDRAPVYLQNLRRLGLVQVSEKPIEDLKRYEIIEAQGHVEQAREQAARPKIIYNSVRLTDFGVEFCELCFPFEVDAQQETIRFRELAGPSE